MGETTWRWIARAVCTALQDWHTTARACLLLLFLAVAAGASVAAYQLVLKQAV